MGLRQDTKEDTQELRTSEDIERLKVIWAYMIRHGQVVGNDWGWSHFGRGYYPRQRHELVGGKWVPYVTPSVVLGVTLGSPYDLPDFSKEDPQKEVIKRALEIGVDFQKTGVPEYCTRGEFVGTGDPARDVDLWEGTLILKDGQEVFISARDIDLSIQVSAFKNKFSDADIVKQVFGD